ncbi:YolA family protein [Pelomonas sp. CA6]|uniref:YolA family protein n=1 Tax=Pelomonas sp. CA6 TaxID=2907999 RepID=UPI001F4A693F|nr:YolA family protein [Pelomonas sp. CA6]MCH7341996.1 YolA family protein [Pelomonas sp. CA6]
MKTTIYLAVLSAAILVALGADAQAQEPPRTEPAMSAMPSPSSLSQPLPAPPTAAEAPGSLRAPAPPLTQMWVYAVGSSNCNWEYTAGRSVTSCNHGGAQLRAAVLEIGYGSARVAWMNGGVLPASARYASTPVCVTGGSYTWPCTPGQTVVGFLNEYNLDGHQSGLFRYQNTSTNSPWNTLAVQISIL